MRRLALRVAALAALLVAGCGGSSGDGSSPEGREAARTTQVVVQTAESGFDATSVYRKAAPGVVTIRSLFDSGGAEGSGFVLDDEGRIVTNAHVVTDGSGEHRNRSQGGIRRVPRPQRACRRRSSASTPSPTSRCSRCEPDGFDLHPLALGSDSQLVVGQPVAAIGSPFGEQQSLSVGVISATDRSVRSLTQFRIEGAIQTDASINPGNSGGPLLDAGARVVGINQQIETNSGANDGVGFAVPISAVKRSIAQLRKGGAAEYAYIGVTSQALYPQLADKLDLDTDFGGLIAEVVSGSPAAKAGLSGGDEKLRFQAGSYETGGDVIVAVEGRKVVRPDDLAALHLVLQTRPDR